MILKNILWDFDGVILDSMEVRDFGFEEIFKDFEKSDVDKLIVYHRSNGGLSRYVKIRHFFENILKMPITDQMIIQYASRFSEIMKKELTKPQNLIQDSLSFIKRKSKNFNFHIVSGSDQEELRFLCRELAISNYFLSIEGSPTPKESLVKDLLELHGYARNETCLIGDSVNDYEAAINNDIVFYGYNNAELKRLNIGYIQSFKNASFYY